VIFCTIRALGNLTLLEANAELFVNVIDDVSFSGSKGHENVFGRRWVYYRSLLPRSRACILLSSCVSNLIDAKVGTSLMAVYDDTNNERTRDMAKETMRLLLEWVDRPLASDIAPCHACYLPCVTNGFSSL
jgi:hypothetical protein